MYGTSRANEYSDSGLVTLNDPQFIEAARVLAQRILLEVRGENVDDVHRLQRLSTILMGRAFSPEELGIVQASLAELTSFYQQDSESVGLLLQVGRAPVAEGVDRTQLAAWTMVVNQLMNLDEVLNK